MDNAAMQKALDMITATFRAERKGTRNQAKSSRADLIAPFQSASCAPDKDQAAVRAAN